MGRDSFGNRPVGAQRRGRWSALRAVFATVLMLGFMPIAAALTQSPAHGASGAVLPGFTQNSLQANDDGSTGLVNLPFAINFFGHTYSSAYINNNGNLTFNQPLGTFTPSGLTTFGSPIIAPFWADVDTAVPGSALVTYGPGTVNGRPAFGINWPGVRCFATTAGGLNNFQAILIDRSDIAAGAFDIEYNYNQIQWETGTA